MFIILIHWSIIKYTFMISSVPLVQYTAGAPDQDIQVIELSHQTNFSLSTFIGIPPLGIQKFYHDKYYSSEYFSRPWIVIKKTCKCVTFCLLPSWCSWKLYLLRYPCCWWFSVSLLILFDNIHYTGIIQSYWCTHQ